VVGCVLAFAALLFFINMTGGGSARQEIEPSFLLARAEKELAANEFQTAENTCKLALLQNPDEATKQHIEALKTKISEQIGRARDKPQLDTAARTIEAIRELARQYPDSNRPRPAQRELARQCKAWLDSFRDVAKQYPDTAVLALEVQTLNDSVAPGAMLSQPDDAGDVLFQAERRLLMTAPLYREVLKSIDDYMAAHPTDKQIDELRKQRTAIADAAVAAFDRFAAEARSLAASGRVAEANKAANAMRNAIIYDAMAVRARTIEKEIDAAAKK
jgi:hypothetical protein